MTRTLFAALCLLVACALPAKAASRDAVEFVDRWIDAYEGFDVDVFLDFYAEDVHFEDPTAQITFESKDALKAAYAGIMQGRWGGNFDFEIKRLVESGDTVVMEGLFSLTWNGEVAIIQFTTWLELADGRIKRQLDLFDYNGLRRQLPEYGQGLPSEYSGPRD